MSQLAMPVNFEAEPHQEGRSRMFSDNEVFSFLYGKTRPQAVNKDVVSAQSVTQASNTGKLCSDITLPCKPSLTHAQLRKDRLEHAWHSRQIHAILVNVEIRTCLCWYLPLPLETCDTVRTFEFVDEILYHSMQLIFP